jgi:hypothetical protein
MPWRFSKLLAFPALLTWGVATAQENSQPALKAEIETLRASVAELRAEVALLRKGIARLELERSRDSIRQLKAELEMLRSEQYRLADTDKSRQQDLHELEELLSRGDLPIEQRTEMQAARIEIAARAREIDQKSEAVRLREDEVLRALQVEEENGKRLEKTFKTIGGKTR